MKILGEDLQLMNDKERKNTHQCFTCGDTSSSVKYFITIGDSNVCFCNKCAALFNNEPSDVIFDTALKNAGKTSSIFEFARDKDFIESVRKEYENKTLSSQSIDEYLDSKYDEKIVDMNNPDHFDKLFNIGYKRIMRFLKDSSIYGASAKPIDEVKIEFGKVPYAVRIYTTNNNQDIAQFKYVGGISFTHNLTVDGYDCFKGINSYTLFYDERITIMSISHFIKNDYTVIEYGENKTPMATIFAGDHSTNQFQFNSVDNFEKYFIKRLLTERRKETNKPIYFIDLREKVPFDSLNM